MDAWTFDIRLDATDKELDYSKIFFSPRYNLSCVERYTSRFNYLSSLHFSVELFTS